MGWPVFICEKSLYCHVAGFYSWVLWAKPTAYGRKRDRQLDYQAAYVEPKLKVPDELSSERVNESLRIPGVNEPTAGLYGGSFEAPRADDFLRAQTLSVIRRHRIGEMRWLSIPEDPSAVWPELERFVSENKLTVFYSRVEKGTQVTPNPIHFRVQMLIRVAA